MVLILPLPKRVIGALTFFGSGAFGGDPVLLAVLGFLGRALCLQALTFPFGRFQLLFAG